MRAALVFLVAAVPLLSCTGYGKPGLAGTDLAFGVDMAKRGLWNEAIFRFQQAEKADPSNSHVQSNLAVAYEARGDFERALEYYKKALQLTPNDKQVRANYSRFVEFYQSYKTPQKGKEGKFGSRMQAPPATAGGKSGASSSPPNPPPPGAAPPAKPDEPPAAPPLPGQPQGPQAPQPVTPPAPPTVAPQPPPPNVPPPAGALTTP